MTLFNKAPDQFPFRVDPDQNPIEYTLQTDKVERIAVAAIAAIVALVITGALLPIAGEIASSFAGEDVGVIVSLGLSLALLAGLIYYVWPHICQEYRTIDVKISRLSVDVHLKEPFRKETWSDALSAYEGITRVNLGSHTFGRHRRNLASVVLKHPDPSRSVPLAIDHQSEIGKKTVRRYAEALKLPVIEGVTDQSGETSYDADTLVVNDRKTWILKAVCWMPVAMAAFVLVTGVPELMRGAENMEWVYIVPPIMLSMTAMIQMFSSYYVVRMREWQGDIWIRTGAILQRDYKFAPDSFTKAKYHEGRSNNGNNSPWIGLSVEGRYFPFVVDLQSEYINENKIYALPKNRDKTNKT